MTKKGRHFIWGEEQQMALEEIKGRLQKPPVLNMPDRKGRFLLYSNTSKHATGSALYYVQDGKPNPIASACQGVPEGAKNYSITELEMCGLAINITSFAHLLKRVDFDAIVDHLAIMHIMKSKMEPATNRIKRLLEQTIHLYYIKGKDMILSDFLVRQQGDDSDPHEIIPKSFNMREIQKQNYYNYVEDKYMVQTRSQNKASGIKVPAVHGARKTLVPHEKPEKQPASTSKSRQGKTKVKRKVKLLPNETHKPVEPKATQLDTQLQDVITMPRQLPHVQANNRQPIEPRLENEQIPPYIHPITRPPPRPPDLDNSNNRTNIRTELITDPNTDFEENSPHKEYEGPDKSYIREPHELVNLLYFQNSAEIPSKTNRHRYNTRYYQKKSNKRHTYTPYYQGNTSRLLN